MNSGKGKTLFVPRHCVDEVEKLIAKRREQHLIKSLDELNLRNQVKLKNLEKQEDIIQKQKI